MTFGTRNVAYRQRPFNSCFVLLKCIFCACSEAVAFSSEPIKLPNTKHIHSLKLPCQVSWFVLCNKEFLARSANGNEQNSYITTNITDGTMQLSNDRTHHNSWLMPSCPICLQLQGAPTSPTPVLALDAFDLTSPAATTPCNTSHSLNDWLIVNFFPTFFHQTRRRLMRFMCVWFDSQFPPTRLIFISLLFFLSFFLPSCSSFIPTFSCFLYFLVPYIHLSVCISFPYFHFIFVLFPSFIHPRFVFRSFYPPVFLPPFLSYIYSQLVLNFPR